MSTNFIPSLVDNLLSWYEKEQRILPWRISSKALAEGVKPDPYHVWLSEIMLQQTIVATVKPYYHNFLKKWPTLNAFYHATLEEVLQNWSGLGYYSRARNLKLCAQKLVENYQARFPETTIELKKLPGIGDYTAAAIAAIAFGKADAVVDGNVERILARIFAIHMPVAQAKTLIKSQMQTLMPTKRSGEFVQAMMDLGALICRPKNPLCSQCPITQSCEAFAQKRQLSFPVKLPKKERPLRYGAVFIALTNKGALLLQKRPEKGLLARMTQLPNYFGPQSAAQKQKLNPPLLADWLYCGDVKHSFTHFTLIFSVYRATFCEKLIPSIKGYQNSYWCDKEFIAQQAFPSLFKKILNQNQILL